MEISTNEHYLQIQFVSLISKDLDRSICFPNEKLVSKTSYTHSYYVTHLQPKSPQSSDFSARNSVQIENVDTIEIWKINKLKYYNCKNCFLAIYTCIKNNKGIKLFYPLLNVSQSTF